MHSNIIHSLKELAALKHDDHSVALDAVRLIENICKRDIASNLENLTARYLLYMLYKGIHKIPNSNSDYIIWLDKMITKFGAQRENIIEDFIEFLMFSVRQHIIESGKDGLNDV